MKNISTKLHALLLATMVVTTAVLLLLPYVVQAEGASGWFAPRVEYVGVAADHCATGQASLELVLVEYGTQYHIGT
jgi:hypothetical protein